MERILSIYKHIININNNMPNEEMKPLYLLLYLAHLQNEIYQKLIIEKKKNIFDFQQEIISSICHIYKTLDEKKRYTYQLINKLVTKDEESCDGIDINTYLNAYLAFYPKSAKTSNSRGYVDIDENVYKDIDKLDKMAVDLDQIIFDKYGLTGNILASFIDLLPWDFEKENQEENNYLKQSNPIMRKIQYKVTKFWFLDLGEQILLTNLLSDVIEYGNSHEAIYEKIPVLKAFYEKISDPEKVNKFFL